mmetsp:Transcript_18531/g.33460  ORF Transcript_18531/g.33460 Transcript_18531/m.33460 type:complete len:271 (-) Transcript_18531:1177-1989(-)
MAEEEKKKNEVKNLPIIRCVVVGPSRVGKSTIVCRFINNYFEPIYTPTDKLRSFRRIFDLMEGEVSDSRQFCMLQIDDVFPIDHPDLDDLEEGESSDMTTTLEKIVDNAKPEKSERGQFPYVGSQIYSYIYCIDPLSQSSVNSIEKFMDYIKVHEDQQTGRKKAFIAVKYLVLAKADLYGAGAYPNKSKIEGLARKYDAKLLEVSALENRNINELFRGLCRSVLDSNIIQLDQTIAMDEEEASEGGFSFFGCCGSRDKSGGESKSKCDLM